MRLMIAGQGEHVTEAVEAGDEVGCLQVPQTQLLVIATADHPLTVWRNRNALNYVFFNESVVVCSMFSFGIDEIWEKGVDYEALFERATFLAGHDLDHERCDHIDRWSIAIPVFPKDRSCSSR